MLVLFLIGITITVGLTGNNGNGNYGNVKTATPTSFTALPAQILFRV
jgi:hypothetical protein